jgi:hypothetical protein
MKNSKGTLGGGDLYSGHLQVIKDSGFVISSSKAESEISERFGRDLSDIRHSVGAQCMGCYN